MEAGLEEGLDGPEWGLENCGDVGMADGGDLGRGGGRGYFGGRGVFGHDGGIGGREYIMVLRKLAVSRFSPRMFTIHEQKVYMA
jgi:hypothetical protein